MTELLTPNQLYYQRNREHKKALMHNHRATSPEYMRNERERARRSAREAREALLADAWALGRWDLVHEFLSRAWRREHPAIVETYRRQRKLEHDRARRAAHRPDERLKSLIWRVENAAKNRKQVAARVARFLDRHGFASMSEYRKARKASYSSPSSGSSSSSPSIASRSPSKIGSA